MRHAPARPLRACCVRVCFTALLPSRDMTCVRPLAMQRQAKTSFLRQPSPCVRAVCACVALLPSNNMTFVRPPCTARPREDFLHTSHASRVLPLMHFNTSPHLSSSYGKAQGFVARLSPKTKPMQHPCTQYNAFRNLTSPTRISLRTWQHNMATFMQPFQCDLQP